MIYNARTSRTLKSGNQNFSNRHPQLQHLLNHQSQWFSRLCLPLRQPLLSLRRGCLGIKTLQPSTKLLVSTQSAPSLLQRFEVSILVVNSSQSPGCKSSTSHGITYFQLLITYHRMSQTWRNMGCNPNNKSPADCSTGQRYVSRVQHVSQVFY